MGSIHSFGSDILMWDVKIETVHYRGVEGTSPTFRSA